MDDDRAVRHRDGPLDEASRARLAGFGLELRAVAHTRPDIDGWCQATARAFLESERETAQIDEILAKSGERRLLGVYDPDSPIPDQPVGTFATWVSELSVPGGRTVPVVAVSAVTVAPTHRRRGIARAMIEGELRHAAACGVPVADLTASESTLYGRYGFAPAAAAAHWRIDVRRAGWLGPVAPGRVDAIARELARRLAPVLHERIRVARPGEMRVPGGQWDRIAGTGRVTDEPGRIRAVQYTDPAGQVRGIALYTVTQNPEDMARSSAHVRYLLATDPESYGALWHHLLTLPLIATVTASELSIDEPLLWMIADQRAATVTVRDHQYLRILDVPAALQARGYETPGSLVLDVADPLGIGAGRWLLEAGADGAGRVLPLDREDRVPGVARLRLGTAELSAAYLGGVSLATLVDAGRVQATDASAARILASSVTPRLSFWY